MDAAPETNTSNGKRDLYIIAAITLAACLLFTGYCVAFRRDERLRAKLTSETPARVLDVYGARQISEQDGRAGGMVYVNINYEYTIDGKSYRRTTRLNKDMGLRFKTTEAAKVCYNPSSPDEAVLVLPAQRCGA